jgi:hypothetical protein
MPIRLMITWIKVYVARDMPKTIATFTKAAKSYAVVQRIAIGDARISAQPGQVDECRRINQPPRRLMVLGPYASQCAQASWDRFHRHHEMPYVIGKLPCLMSEFLMRSALMDRLPSHFYQSSIDLTRFCALPDAHADTELMLSDLGTDVDCSTSSAITRRASA